MVLVMVSAVRDTSSANLIWKSKSARSKLVTPSNTLTVNTTADSGPNSLRGAIANASDGDTIVFDSSLANQTITLTSGELVINKNLTIQWTGSGSLTVSGNNATRVFNISSDKTVQISGLTIANGNTDLVGGGIFNSGVLTMTNCTVSGNSAGNGGGGIRNEGKLTMTNCTVSGNSANTFGGDGGGISNSSTLTMTNCTVSGNRALVGGGISNFSTLTMTNCTVSGNSAPSGGGGIRNEGTLTMTNCTVSGNSAPGGGGIINFATLNLNNSIVANNSALSGGPDISGSVSSGDFNLIKNTSGISGTLPGSNNITGQDPKLAPLGNYGGPTQTHALLCGSPAIDRGSNNLAKDENNNTLTTDQRGSARIVNTTVDIGAFEAGIFLCPTSLPFAVVGQSYNQVISAVGGASPYTFSLASGSSLPQGLSLSTSGTISGTPTQTGTFTFIVVAKDSSGFAGACQYVLGVGNLSTVSSTTDSSNCSGCLRAAINNAQSGDTIQINATGTITLTGVELVINKDLMIVGPGAGSLTVSGIIARVFNISSGVNVTISGLTIANSSAGSGGGISNSGTLTMTNCTVSGNSAGPGGGGIANGGTLTMTNCTVSGNIAGFGGGISNSGTLTMTNCTVSGNSAPGVGGGGIGNSGTLTMTNCTVSGNSAVPFGGGGILNNVNGKLTMTNCTVSGNSASGGGGISNLATLTMTNCTVSGNSAVPGDSGGIRNFATLNLNNSIVANNTASSGPDISGPVSSGDFNLIGNTSGISGSLPGSNNITGQDPKLAPLGDYGGPTQTHALLCGSPAIDSGSNQLVAVGCSLTTDQRGSARIVNSLVDIGAFEANIFLSPTSLPDAVKDCFYSQTISATGGSSSYTFSLAAGSSLPNGLNLSGSTISGTPSQAGTSTFIIIAKDSNNFAGGCQYTLNVVNSAAPSITCPGNITVNAEQGKCSALVNFTVTASGSPNPTITCTPPPGSSFSVGTTTVTCTASNCVGQASCSFTVTVKDTQTPAITCPANVTAVAAAQCPPATGKVVTFPVPVAVDNCPGVTTVCTPPSDSTFPVGTTTVTCTATDGSGNVGVCSFSVTVFNGCVQDDSNSGNIALFNTFTGDYVFLCGGVVAASGKGTPTLKGCVFSLQHNPADRRVLINVDFATRRGSASLQKPPGSIKCTIMDRNISNNTCS